ncbi:general transcription factor IIH subunit 3-like isoform X2 [Convolutriloba macropyga]|uniref:general transcription factor IIH subunit 3-like isoform X2 n=1 Tax=Convolutriloba macropyga TaxID=536237 RepID=UPI003F5201F4
MAATADFDVGSPLLFVLADVHPYWWGRLTMQKKISISFDDFIDQIAIFSNAYLSLSSANSLCAAAFHFKDCILFRSEDHFTNQQFQGSAFCNQFSQKVADFMSNMQEDRQSIVDKKLSERSGFVPALIKSLCMANKILKSDPDVKIRFLILKVSPILSAEYLPLMNCLFACQKEKLIVDVFSLCFYTTSLQQMSALSNGTFFKCPEDANKILHFLSAHFLMSAEFREKKLIKPSSQLLDYKASCFCHRRLVDVGWICSVCLSVFCAFTPICITCSSIFRLPSAPAHASSGANSAASGGTNHRKRKAVTTTAAAK